MIFEDEFLAETEHKFNRQMDELSFHMNDEIKASTPGRSDENDYDFVHKLFHRSDHDFVSKDSNSDSTDSSKDASESGDPNIVSILVTKTHHNSFLIETSRMSKQQP